MLVQGGSNSRVNNYEEPVITERLAAKMPSHSPDENRRWQPRFSHSSVRINSAPSITRDPCTAQAACITMWRFGTAHITVVALGQLCCDAPGFFALRRTIV